MIEQATNSNISNLVKIATQPADDIARWAAIEELAHQAIQDRDVLAPLLTAMRGDKTIKLRYRPYGTFMAIAHILDFGDRRAIQMLLAEMDTWTAQEQEDALGPWAGYRSVEKKARDLASEYGWRPKFHPHKGLSKLGPAG